MLVTISSITCFSVIGWLIGFYMGTFKIYKEAIKNKAGRWVCNSYTGCIIFQWGNDVSTEWN